MKFLLRIIAHCIALFASLSHAVEALDFNRDIRPILSSKCFACHGPDEQERDADLRLDVAEGAFADLGGYAAIVPGKLEESEAIYRITTDDESDLMPPPKHKNPLTEEEISILERWVSEGAPYAKHWAFEPVVGAEDASIDQFISSRLSENQLAFSAEAAPETLIRRLHLDLTGLPPTPEEMDAFLADPDGQYTASIDRLLASSGFAERLAGEWLDVARFADTNGYSIDDHRDVWVWRDWVIDAFAKNLPYDEFISVQLAGDLFDKPSEHDLVATGFLRNAMNTHEGGTIDEEYRVARIADQVDTVSTAFLGLTVKCAQCHDHKYDPISQRDYFRMFAFFNKTSEPGKGAGKGGNTPPKIEVDPILQDPAEYRATIERRLSELRSIRANPATYLDNPADAPPASDDSFLPFPKKGEVPDLAWIWAAKEGEWGTATFRKTINLDALPERAELFVSCDNEARVFVNGKPVGEVPDWREPGVLDVRAHLKEGENLIAIVGENWEGETDHTGLFAVLALSDGRFIGTDATWEAAVQKPKGWKELGDVEGFAPAVVVAPHLGQPWGDVFARVSGSAPPVSDAFKKLRDALNGEIALLQASLKSGKTSAMVMDSGEADRETSILIRGAYDQHGEIVDAGVPAIFGDLPRRDEAKADRLDLARWLTDPSNPLTARVTVNRYWQMLFGTGLVKTAEDFGSQGEWPSHPELLDWLASEFVASGWDVRTLFRQMLTSRTYRQSSEIDPAQLEADPYNRLLARAPRHRLHAEAVRDSALAIGGLLGSEIGGPSVYPPQPKGLWKNVSHFGHSGFFSAQHFFADEGEPTFRRSMYTFWKRTSPPPVMTTFDAPNRETCSVRRSSTNTPLQALVLMNEPQFLAAARGLAIRMIGSAGDLREQLKNGFRIATGRYPSDEELSVLEQAYSGQLEYFISDPQRVTSFLGNGGNPTGAAMATVASLILNLDETITRE